MISFKGFFVFYLIIVIVLANFGTEVSAGQRYGKNQTSNNKEVSNESKDDTKPRTPRGVVLSAWGIVVLVVSIILLCVAGYYLAIFYPILCKKERKYDRIELSTI